MVSIKIKVGPKGQIVIPKVLREEYNIVPGDEVIFRENNNVVVIEKAKKDIIEVFERARKSVKKKKIKFDIHGIEKEYEERWRKAKNALR